MRHGGSIRARMRVIAGVVPPVPRRFYDILSILHNIRMDFITFWDRLTLSRPYPALSRADLRPKKPGLAFVAVARALAL